MGQIRLILGEGAQYHGLTFGRGSGATGPDDRIEDVVAADGDGDVDDVVAGLGVAVAIGEQGQRLR